MTCFHKLAITSVLALFLTACGSGSTMPAPDRQVALLKEFQSSKWHGCSARLKSGVGTRAEYTGAGYWICAGRFSSEEPYAITLISKGTERVPSGMMLVEMQKSVHPLAYRHLYPTLFKLMGIKDEDEQKKFKSAIFRFNLVSPPGRGFKFLYSGDDGPEAEIANNRPGRGSITIRIKPQEA